MSKILFMIVRFSLVLVLCLLLIQLELALLLIAAELITLINLLYGYFEFNT